MGIHWIKNLCPKMKSAVLVVVPLVAGVQGSLALEAYQEAPMFRKMVEAGELPLLEERLPEDILVVELGTYGIHGIGRYGGSLRFDAVDAPNVQGFTDLTVPFFYDGNKEYRPLVFAGYESSDDFR